MTHRKWKETKVQPSTAGPGNMLGYSLVSFHFLWTILCPQAVLYFNITKIKEKESKCKQGSYVSHRLCEFIHATYFRLRLQSENASCVIVSSLPLSGVIRIGLPSIKL